MENDDLAVLGQLNVELDAVAVGRGALKRCQRVLGHGLVALMQTAVRKVFLHKGLFLLSAYFARSDDINKTADGGCSRKSGKLHGAHLIFHNGTSKWVNSYKCILHRGGRSVKHIILNFAVVLERNLV